MNVGKIDKVADFKLHDLRCFDAIVRAGSFQAAARALNRTHPSVFAAVSRLESRLGLALLDRAGYRVALTEAGYLFHARAVLALRELDNLRTYAEQLSDGEETVLDVVLGDLCPRPMVLRVLSEFFVTRGRTRLHLDYEAVGGPTERLRNETADLVFHRADPFDTALEQIRLLEVRLVPVAAAGYLPFKTTEEVTPEQMRPFTQCVIRDTARETAPEDHFLVQGSHQCTVPDHAMKKELIQHGMAWGHLPEFLVEHELQMGSLIMLQGRHMPGRIETLAALRRRDRPHGPVAEELWLHLTSAFESFDS